MSQPTFIYHGARRNDRHPPSSLSGLADCLAAGARIVEVDIVPLAGGDFALVHDASLQEVSEGSGPVAAATAAQVISLHHRWRGHIAEERLGLLSQAVAMIRERPGLAELQLDLKPHAPLTDAVLGGLARQVEPVQARVRVSSTADWAIRRLAALAPDLPLGFDPLLYLDVARTEEREAAPPLHTGAYGYADDHPLASRRWGTAADYLAARADALWVQAPVDMWYIRGAMLARALDDGFDWIAWLHSRGAQVVAWTLDADQPHQLDLARRLAAAGVDRITTNDAGTLARAMGG